MKKRILTAVASLTLALAAILGLGATPALAETTYTQIPGTTTSFEKKLIVDSDSTIPAIEFSYQISPGTDVPASSDHAEIHAGPTGATIGKAVFSSGQATTAGIPGDGTQTGKKYATANVEVDLTGANFSKPGIYRYVITELQGSNPGVTYDTTSRYLDVFIVVGEGDALEVKTYTLRTSRDNIDPNTGRYLTNPDQKTSGYENTITNYDFEISKIIAGNQGDKNKTFSFTLEITNANPGTYTVEAENVSSVQNITVGANKTGSATYLLTHESKLKVLGLNKDAVCTVSEVSEDYQGAYSLNGATSVNGTQVAGIALTQDTKIAFTNTRNGIIPTGVILTVAPFAIGLMLFGALTVLFVSKSMRKHV